MFAVVRVSGKMNLNRAARDTLKMLRLDYTHNCIILPETPTFKGMINKVKDHVAYGEIDKQTLVELLRKRMRAVNDEKVDESKLKEMTGHNSHGELADALMGGKVTLSALKNVKPILRLASPSKGFKAIKSHYPEGDLGYRGKEINELLERMM